MLEGVIVTWKQFVRSIEASQRRSHRENIRRQRQHLRQTVASAREAARNEKQWAKEKKWREQSSEAAQFEQYMEALVSLHTDWGESWDWQAISQTPPPVEPKHDPSAQIAAQAALEAYKPGLLDRISGAAKLMRAQLTVNVAHAIESEAENYQAATARYEQDRQVWETCVRLAPAVLRLNLPACVAALRHAHSFEDVELFGTAVELAKLDGDAATLSMY